ncbi:MAG: PTS sugar transporter subunit IIA [Erysipelotrichaceae bacterium]|nr:PTS sugar transporter subunit IIA [Erysipelotrichaceae bacterium]
MVGIVLISHGEMANGMLNSAGMFFGETELQQVATVSLHPADSPEDFDVKLTDAIASVDTGDGVIIMCDLLGGTPCNRAAYKCSEKVQVLTGMNLSMLMEALGCRGFMDPDVDTLEQTAKDGIMNYNKLLSGGM